MGLLGPRLWSLQVFNRKLDGNQRTGRHLEVEVYGTESAGNLSLSSDAMIQAAVAHHQPSECQLPHLPSGNNSLLSQTLPSHLGRTSCRTFSCYLIPFHTVQESLHRVLRPIILCQLTISSANHLTEAPALSLGSRYSNSRLCF